MSKFISVISAKSFLQDGRLCMSSSVKTDWNCSFNTLDFAQTDVACKPEIVLRVGMPVSSLCKALIYDQLEHICRLARMLVLDTEVHGSNPGSSMLFP